MNNNSVLIVNRDDLRQCRIDPNRAVVHDL